MQGSWGKILQGKFWSRSSWRSSTAEYVTDARDGTISGGDSKLPKRDSANGNKNRAGEGETKSLLFVHISKILQGPL